MLTAERLREVLDYNPETGVFTWKKRISQKSAVGKTAGSIEKVSGYVSIRIDKKLYMAHRLAWLMMLGEWPGPGHEIDHVNGNRADNRWGNLRLATRGQNNANQKISRRNTSGFKGVTARRNGTVWTAQIGHRGEYIHIGVFDSPELAHAAYLDKAGELFGDFARGS